MTPIADDERFKAGCHGLLLGCTLPVLAFNLTRRKALNSCLYTGIVLMEVWHIIGHLRVAKP